MTNLAEQVQAGTLQPEEITEEKISAALDTAGIPEPDLLIRTCNELRISNFLLWQLAYTEFYFTPVAWPDFSKEAVFPICAVSVQLTYFNVSASRIEVVP